jgi:mannose-6-phosphate isomerase
MELLENVIREYAWGSRTALAQLLGRPSPARAPQAELWMGAHPGAPSKVLRGGRWVSLADVITEAPGPELGPQCLKRFGPRLPFLFKVLCAESPLSLQAHPSEAQAKAGFAREEAAGVPLGAAHRNYKDPHHKPELLCALTDFEALCGFRAAAETLRLFKGLAAKELAPFVAMLEAQPGALGLKAVFEKLMTLPAPERGPLVTATLAACKRRRDLGQAFAKECGWAVKLGEQYPGDVGAVSALLLNLVTLQPGEAVFMPAGNLHAYLKGVGVELMASSDNVLRGGLTPKHVDVPELLSVLDFRDGPVPVQKPRRATDGEELYLTPAAEFRLSRVVLDKAQRHRAQPHGPEILLCTEGAVRLHGADCELELPRGAAAWVSAQDGVYELRGTGTVYRATIA